MTKYIKKGSTFYDVEKANSVSISSAADGSVCIYLDMGPTTDYDIEIDVDIHNQTEIDIFVKKMFGWLNYKSSPNVFDVDKVASDIHGYADYLSTIEEYS